MTHNINPETNTEELENPETVPAETAQDETHDQTPEETPETETEQDTDPTTSKLINKLKRENANLRTRLRAAEENVPALDTAHWQLLEAVRGTTGIQLGRDAMEKLGHSISEFRNDDGTLNHDKYESVVHETAMELGIPFSPVIPRGGYLPEQFAGSTFTQAIQGNHA